MMKARLPGIVLSIVIVSCLCFSYGCGCLGGYRLRSEESIRMKLLKQTPMGLSREEVLKRVNSKYGSQELSERHVGIEHKYSGLKYGFISRKVKGYFYIFPIIGTEIDAVWIFNKEGKLEDIEVSKYNVGIGN